ncbi:MAG: DUF255 domain-containing protein [Gammaproteobacteria bacterium]
MIRLRIIDAMKAPRFVLSLCLSGLVLMAGSQSALATPTSFAATDDDHLPFVAAAGNERPRSASDTVQRDDLAAARGAPGARSGQSYSSRIEWRAWSPEAFAEARRSGKLILLDVGMEGCTACRNMSEITYADAAVIARVAANFIPIQVDAEARPDLGERYSDWAWPATVFMTPDAEQVLALRGNRLPQNFLPILDDLLERQAAGTLQADELAPYAAPAEPSASALSEVRDELRQRLDRHLAGDGSRAGSGARLQAAFMRAHMYDDEALRQRALSAAEDYLNLLDPVWGGVFVARSGAGEPIPEKRISHQAHALNVFAEAYMVSRDPRFAAAIDAVLAYLDAQMTSPHGTFYTSQQDRPAQLPRDVSRDDYWAADDAKRRRWGLPVTDRAVYTDKNGELVVALVQAFVATDERRLLAAAERAAAVLMVTRQTAAGWIQQTAQDEFVDQAARKRALSVVTVPFLSAQAWFGSALLALHTATGQPYWLDHAGTIARAMETTLIDRENGGFYAKPSDPEAVIAPRKPLEFNARAAHFLYDLAILRKQPQLARAAEAAVRAVAIPHLLRREGRMTGELALALETLTAAYVEFSIVSRDDNGQANALFAAARGVYHPRKILHHEAPGRYPARERPALYICNPDYCSVPIEDPAEIEIHAGRIRAPASVPAFSGNVPWENVE